MHQALADALDDEWTVLHSVGWQSERYGRQGDGEADFVLLSRRGVLVLEVKGGTVSVVDGKWRSVSARGAVHDIFDPFRQALDSRKALTRYLQDKAPEIGRLGTGHAVCFPDIRVTGGFGPEAPTEIIIDREDLDDLGRAISGVMKHWELQPHLDPSTLKRIRGLLAPTVTVKPILADIAADVERELLRLTDQQIAAMQGLRRNRRMLIFGGAGTGKTVLATAHTRRLVDEGFNVLFLCFNEPLGNKLKREFSGEGKVTAGHVSSFGVKAIESAGHKMVGAPADHWWDRELPELVAESADRLPKFGALVIDEGQDFHPNWWVPLQLLLADPDDAPFYLFADTAQQLYRKGWIPPFDGPSLELTVNCRNTLPIAAKVSRAVGVDVPVLGADGPAPGFVVVRGEDSIPGAVRRVVNELKVEGFNAGQITVLTTCSSVRDALRNLQFRPRSAEEALDDDVLVDTVHRFKGLESDAIVLALCGTMFADPALVYVGMSRAKLILTVVGADAARKAINWE